MRVRGSGNLARWLAIPIGGLFLLSGVVWFGSSDEKELAAQAVPALVILVPASYFFARSWVVGIWLTDAGVTTRSWFRTHRVKRSNVVRCEAVGYSGFLNKFTESSRLKMVVLRLGGGGSIVVRAVVAPRRLAVEHARTVSAHLGLRTPDPLVAGPTHRRAET